MALESIPDRRRERVLAIGVWPLLLGVPFVPRVVSERILVFGISLPPCSL